MIESTHRVRTASARHIQQSERAFSLASDDQDSQPRPDFEQALAELETIMHDLEDGKLGLAEGLARYERGIGSELFQISSVAFHDPSAWRCQIVI